MDGWARAVIFAHEVRWCSALPPELLPFTGDAAELQAVLLRTAVRASSWHEPREAVRARAQPAQRAAQPAVLPAGRRPDREDGARLAQLRPQPRTRPRPLTQSERRALR